MPEITQEELDRYKGLEKRVEELNAEAATHRRAKKDAIEQLTEATSQIKTLQEAIEKPNADFKAKEAELTTAAQKSREYGDSMRARYEGKLIDEAIASAAIKGRAVDPQVVAKLVRESVGIDDKGEIFVKSGEGVATDDAGARLSVEKLVSGFLTKNPYLVSATGMEGSGSGGGRNEGGGVQIKRADFDALPPAARAAKVKAGVAIVD
jgi:hypothetical protein